MCNQPKKAEEPSNLQADADSTKGKPDTNTEDFTNAVPPEMPPSAEVILKPGDVVNEYEIEAVIDEGNFGTVYRAFHATLDRSVALKVAKLSPNESDETTRRFIKEARTLAKIEHSGIVPVYDSGEISPGVPYVAMRLIQGESLESRLARERMGWREAHELGIVIADALAYAHEKGVIHRDLKPANILLDQSGNPLLADFGLALHYEDQLSHENEFAGTVAYMSPEQIRRESHWLDGRTDIWSLGVILYEVAVHRHPFRSDHKVKLAEEILSREPWSLRQIDRAIPLEFEEIVTKCLRKEVADRYPSAADLACKLREFSNETAPTSDSIPRAEPSSKNWIPVFAFTALLTTVLIIGAIAIQTLTQQPGQSSPPDSYSDSALASTFSDPEEQLSNRLPTAVAGELSGLSVSIDLLIWNPRDNSRQGVSIRNLGALPLRKADQIRLNVSLNQPAYLYLAWIDSEGNTLPVYPWEPGNWSARPVSETRTQRLSLPDESDHGWPMEGVPGMETLIVLARMTPLPSTINLEKAFSNLPLQPVQDPRAAVWFQDGKLVTSEHGGMRAPKFFDASKIDDPLLETQRLLCDRLKQYFETIEAVSFAKRTD
jgi:serine/threonine protein kinase